MNKQERADLITLLRSYPSMRTALRCLSDQIDAEVTALELIQRGSDLTEEEDQQIIDEHMFLIESLSGKKKMLESRVRAIERTLRTLSDLERTLLSSFYFEPYDKDTPIRLMEEFSYEKSQLYHKRGQAMEKFYHGYFGIFSSPLEGSEDDQPTKKRNPSKRITSQ